MLNPGAAVRGRAHTLAEEYNSRCFLLVEGWPFSLSFEKRAQWLAIAYWTHKELTDSLEPSPDHSEFKLHFMADAGGGAHRTTCDCLGRSFSCPDTHRVPGSYPLMLCLHTRRQAPHSKKVWTWEMHQLNERTRK